MVRLITTRENIVVPLSRRLILMSNKRNVSNLSHPIAEEIKELTRYKVIGTHT